MHYVIYNKKCVAGRKDSDVLCLCCHSLYRRERSVGYVKILVYLMHVSILDGPDESHAFLLGQGHSHSLTHTQPSTHIHTHKRDEKCALGLKAKNEKYPGQ